ncbi:ribosomal RNA small subunit methyltransferase A [Prauserella cavernicola]|uniref:rRNA adenine N(6)-methyltransferase family protein n=1 Tax=Prauserella cavernicola TaxID=2800127 RepID=A0A934QPX7_9PSEU|nr:rRNA adenine N(6)-methyltransferase family protein [Prauserella cavernicola]MBK1786037.1 rRNA adenine N(6)-methyltransferase family protein [Prauserella cavernicola]
MPTSRPARSRKPGPNPSGVHFLASARVADGLIRSCSPKPSDLVVDFGAGFGAITAPLARTGARVIAVERDADFARKLGKRVAASGNVRVVTADAREFPLPRTSFLVVASIPYSISTALVRRLLTPRTSNLRRAALIVEWGFAKRLTAAAPRSREVAWWAARFDLELERRIPPNCFQPAPTVDSAQLTIRRRARLGPGAEQALSALLDAVYRTPQRSTRAAVAEVIGGRPHRILHACDLDPAAPAGSVRPRRWAALAIALDGNSQQLSGK